MLPCSPVKQQQQPICGGSSSDNNSALGPLVTGIGSCNKNMVNSSDVAAGTTTPTATTNGDPYTFVDPENDNNIPVLPAQHRLAKNRKLANVRHSSSDSMPGANEHAVVNHSSVDVVEVNFSGHLSQQQQQQQGVRTTVVTHQNQQNPGARLPVNNNGPISSPQFGGPVRAAGPVQYCPPNGNSSQQQPQPSGGFSPPSSAQQFQPRSGTSGGGHFIALPPPPPIPTPPPPVIETNGPWPSSQQQPVGIRPPVQQPPPQNQQQQQQPRPPQLYQLPIAAYQQRQETAQHARQFVMHDQQQQPGQFTPQQPNAQQSPFQPSFPPQQATTPQQQFLVPPPNQRIVKAEPLKESTVPKRKSSSNNLAHTQTVSTPNGPPVSSPVVAKPMPVMQQNLSTDPDLPLLSTEELLDSRLPVLARVSFGPLASKLPSMIGKERPVTKNKGVIQQCAARVYFPSEAAFMAYAYWASRRMFHSDMLGHSEVESVDESSAVNEKSPVIEDVDTEIAEIPIRSEWFITDDEITAVPVHISPINDAENLRAIENRRIAVDRLRASLKQALVLRRTAFKTNTMPRGHNALEAQQLAQLFAEDRRLLYRLLHRTRIPTPDRAIFRRLLRRAGGPEVFAPLNRKRCACDIADARTQNPAQSDPTQGQNCQRCQNPALPFANHCPLHITYSVDQKLFEHCTGRSNDIQRCHRPAFDVRRPQAPLCSEHSLLGATWNSGQGNVPSGDGHGTIASQTALQPSGTEAPKSAKRKRSRAKKKAGGSDKPPVESTGLVSTSSFSSPPNQQQNFSTSESGPNNDAGNNSDFNDILNASGHENTLGEVGPDMHLFDDNMIDDFLSTLPADSRDFHRILQDSQHDRGQGDMDPFGPPESQGITQNQQGGSSGSDNGSSGNVAMMLTEQGGEQVQQAQSQQNFAPNQQGPPPPPPPPPPQQQQFAQPMQSPSSTSSSSTNRNWSALSPNQAPPQQPAQTQQAQQPQPQQQMQSPAANYPPQQQQSYMMPPPWSPNGPVQQQPTPDQQQPQQMQYPPQSPQRAPMNSPASVNVFFGGPNPPTPQANPQTMNGFISPGPQSGGQQQNFHYQQTPPHHHALMKTQSLQPNQMMTNGPMQMPMSPVHVQQQQGPQPSSFVPQQAQFAAPPLHRTFSQPQQQPQAMEVQHPVPPSHLGLQQQQPRPPTHFAAGVHSSPMIPQQQGGFIGQQGQGGYQPQQQYHHQQQALWMQQAPQGFMPQQQLHQQQMYMAQQQQQFVPQQQQQFVGQMTMHHHPQPQPPPQNRSMY